MSRKSLGEADYTLVVRVRPDVYSEQDEWCWVSIRKGNKQKGTGALLHVTPTMSKKGVKPGDVIFYVNGSNTKPPRFQRKAKVPNQLAKLIVSMVDLSKVESLRHLLARNVERKLPNVLATPTERPLSRIRPEPPARLPERQKPAKLVQKATVHLQTNLAEELKQAMQFNPSPTRIKHEPREQVRLRVWDAAHH